MKTYKFKKTLMVFSLSKHLTKLKKLARHIHWNLVGSQAIQDVSERIRRAYALFFSNLKHNEEYVKVLAVS